MKEDKGTYTWKRQIRRWFVIVIGFGLLPVGLVLLALPFLPGGTLVTLASLGILATEFSWAQRLLNSMKRLLEKVGRAVPMLSKKSGKAGVEARLD